MTFYSVVLFLHIVSVLGLFAALSLEMLALARLRGARNITEAQAWADPVPTLPAIAISSLLVLLFSGIYLTVRLQAWTLAWPKVAVISLLLIAPLGAATGRRMRAIRRMAKNRETSEYLRVRQSVASSFLSISIAIRTAMVLGIVLIMAAKPSLWVSVAIVAVSVALGLLAAMPGRGKAVSSAVTSRS